MIPDHLELLEALAAGNYHWPGAIRALQIGSVPPDRYQVLRRELLDVADTNVPSLVGAGHVTGWTRPVGTVCQWSLLNRHGDTANPAGDFTYHDLAAKHTIDGYEHLAAFASTLPGLVNLRLNMLGPDAALSPHEEHLPFPLDGDRVGLRARFHLPVDTNPDALMLADGDWFRFHPGVVYLFNNGCVHSATNTGSERRLHLVWDQLLTRPACHTMFDAGSEWLDIALDELPVVGREELDDWQRSRGMPPDEYDRRTIDYMPEND